MIFAPGPGGNFRCRRLRLRLCTGVAAPRCHRRVLDIADRHQDHKHQVAVGAQRDGLVTISLCIESARLEINILQQVSCEVGFCTRKLNK